MPAYRAILIAGPTGSGKSSLALELAARLNGAVVNADSMQVYRELRVLTARPTAGEEARVPHRLYGYVAAAEAHSVGRWLDDVRGAIAAADDEGRPPILVGGTGLYFRALLEGLSPVPDIPAEVRRRWRQAAAEMTPADLHRQLAALDPVMAGQVRASDPQRIVRALEVVEATGRSLADWQAAAGVPVVAAATAARLVLAPARASLVARIDARFDRMLAQGALEEARVMAGLGLDSALPAMRAHGVRPLIAHLRGEIGIGEAAALVKAETRQYAKRQMTWARRYMADWTWVETPEAALAAVATGLPAG